MAETPNEEQLGAAQDAVNESATALEGLQTSFTEAEEAWKADEENDDLKTAFDNAKVKFDEHTTSHSTLEETLKNLQSQGKEFWPEDWRKEIAGDDEKLLKRLNRYGSPKAVSEALVAAQDKIASGQMAAKLGENPTDEEIKEYREANGIPENAKDYSLDMSEGLVVGDDDKEMLKGFLDSAHANNYSQDQVTKALEWYYGEQERIQTEMYQNDLQFKADSEDILRQEWGSDYTPNRNLMANYLSTDFGEGVGDLIAGARLADGTMLANHPDILRGFVAKARAANPMGALVPGSGTKQMDSMLDEIAELEKKMEGDDWYKDKKSQERYLKLIEARDKMKDQ